MINERDCLALLEYLKKQDNKRWVSKKEICNAMPEIFVYNENKNSHDECVYLWSCKNFINNNVEMFDYIIISNKKGEIKIPSDEEARKFLENEFRNCCIKFKRYWNKAKSLKLINQGKLDETFYKIIKNF